MSLDNNSKGRTMKLRTALVIFSISGLLASCAHIEPNPYPGDMASAVRSAETSDDHEALARRYDDLARSMQTKAEQQKRTVEEYKRHAYYYGRQTDDQIESAQALVQVYQDAANAYTNLAHYHRRVAQDMKQWPSS
jgi:DNA repair exonuclease SbcCD ATPase subunit